jgi:hypothetical protein
MMTLGRLPQRRAAFLLRLFFLISISFCSALGLAAEGQEPLQNYKPRFYPFADGEKAVYQASWLGIPVASAEIEMQPAFLEGKKFYQVKVEARSWRYLELIFKMRDTVESTFDAETLHPRRFFFRQRENRKRIDTTAVVDSATNKWVVHRQEGKKPKDFEFISPYTLDPISATYLARSLDFKVGDRLWLEVFGGKSRYLVTLDVVGRERVSVKKGEFDAYKVVPQVSDLSKSGYAKRVRQATVWITADEKRSPIKMSSQVFIGSVNIEMVDGKN